MKHSHLAKHDPKRRYLVQWIGVDNPDERFATIQEAIERMVNSGLASETYQDAFGDHGFHRAAAFDPIRGWRYCID